MGRLTIRRMTLEDIPFFNEVRAQSVNFLHDKTHYTINDNIQWFETQKPRFFILENHYEPIGYFRTSNWINSSAYIGLDIHPRFRGRGIATEAYLQFMNILKLEYKLNTLYLEVLNTNRRALHIYNKIGFIVIDTEPYDNEIISVKMKKTL